MNPAWTLLLGVLREPARMAELSEAQWDLVQRQALTAGLLARLGALADAAEITERLPKTVRRHMQAMQALAEQKYRAVHWELEHLQRDLAGLEGPVLLLKGAAYAAADLAPAPGRLFGDIDLLVPKSQLDAAESALMLSGWVSASQSGYDERYYRQWMHELPPMMHIRRQSALDLHHNILPETARLKTQPALILASARPLARWPRFSVPCDTDLILHSATHLFHEGEWEHGLRDLVDLDALIRSSMRDAAQWQQLLDRAAQLGLGRPLFYGLRYCARLLGTPVPAEVLSTCPARPGALGLLMMDALFINALSTAHKGSRSRLAGPASFALYVRSHYLRMPLHLLLPHLFVKAWQRRFAKNENEPAATTDDTQAPAQH